jgi:hypothetical protein
MAAGTPLTRITLGAASVADDLGYVALTDLARALGGLTEDYRVIGGHMVTVLAARWQLGHELYRETGDVDLGIPPIVARDHNLVSRLKDLNYLQVAGNRFARGLSDIPAGMKERGGSGDPEALIDVLVPAYTSRARENVQVGEDLFTTEVPGLQLALTPLWTVTLALAVRQQKSVTRRQAAGLIVGFAGAVLIFSPWRTASGLFSAGGLECLAAAVSYAISYVYMDRFLARRGISATVRSACQLAAAAVMLAITLGVSGVQTPHVTAESLAAIAVLGIVGTGFAYVLNYQIIASDGATVASTVTYLLPVVAIVLGVVVLNETIMAIVLAGIALVLAGVALTRRRA